MAAPYGLDSDWQYLDGFEPVTLYRKTATGFDAGTLVPHAVRITSAKDLTGEPMLAAKSLPWLLCPAECSPAGQPDPKSQDVLSAADGRWTIDSVRSFPLESAHRVETRKEVPL